MVQMDLAQLRSSFAKVSKEDPAERQSGAGPQGACKRDRSVVGQWVEVRSKEEILATLDKSGRLDGMPFMPQMFQYCGQRFQVYKRAHKTCDTVSGDYLGRRLPSGVHLEHRCDGAAYGGCEAGCLIFWKEAWLTPVDDNANALQAKANRLVSDRQRSEHGSGATEEDVSRATHGTTPEGRVRYFCQATELLNFTQPLPWWDMRQYLEDLRSGNISLRELFRGFAYVCSYYGTLADRRTLGRPARWLHETVRPLWGGRPMPRARGRLPLGAAAPVETLNLQPGELVRVKPFETILETIDWNYSNRGLTFDAEMRPHCGRVFRVVRQVRQFIDEKTGVMRYMKTPAVILEGGVCGSRYSPSRMFCPRRIYTWWREIWLDRIEVEINH
jgi:hypothetical protein